MAFHGTDRIELVQWLRSVPFSRPIRKIASDFWDGGNAAIARLMRATSTDARLTPVLLAEIISHEHPGAVNLREFTPGRGIRNWGALGAVLEQLGCEVSDGGSAHTLARAAHSRHAVQVPEGAVRVVMEKNAASQKVVEDILWKVSAGKWLLRRPQ
jgi:hypothetical protein